MAATWQRSIGQYTMNIPEIFQVLFDSNKILGESELIM